MAVRFKTNVDFDELIRIGNENAGKAVRDTAAYVQKVTRNSMKKGFRVKKKTGEVIKKTNTEGRPPFYHDGDLRNAVAFKETNQTKTGYAIGPDVAKKSFARGKSVHGSVGLGAGPNILEFGGRVARKKVEKSWEPEEITLTLEHGTYERRSKHGKVHTVTYPRWKKTKKGGRTVKTTRYFQTYRKFPYMKPAYEKGRKILAEKIAKQLFQGVKRRTRKMRR